MLYSNNVVPLHVPTTTIMRERNNGTPTSWNYYVTDHLGNVRQVTEADGSREGNIIQKVNYYPFGAEFCDGTANNSVQPYKYNGKELDLMHGLNTYDYGARQYNPITARWDRIDPLCEKYYSVSPYAYCGGNPVRFIDPNGKWKWDVNGNLISEGRDNEYTLSDFLNTSVYNASLLLSTYRILHNNNNEYLEGGIVLNKDNLYIMEIDYAAPVVHNTKEAVIHYYHGNGEPADVGDGATAMLMNTPRFKANLEATTTQYRESGEFQVDMTDLVFHIGRTPVSYAVHHGVKSSHVDFHLFQYKNGKMDSFSDPLDLGFEIFGGTKYDYKPRTVTFYFKPVK